MSAMQGGVRERVPAGRAGRLPRHVRVMLRATAHRFGAGHRLRVQISGGAHPRFARNTGTGEPLATATGLVAVDIEIGHGPSQPVCCPFPQQQPTAPARPPAGGQTLNASLR